MERNLWLDLWRAPVLDAIEEQGVEARGIGCHTALLRRLILDAGKRRPTLLAETTEPLGERDGPSAGARNLLRAGFRQASVRAVWRRG